MSLRDSTRMAGWLVSTARREAWRLMRRRGATPISQISEGDWQLEMAAPLAQEEARAPDAEALALEEQHLVPRAMEQLAERCRRLLSLLYVRDPSASYQEVSEALDISVGSIGPNRTRCLQHLRKFLDELGF